MLTEKRKSGVTAFGRGKGIFHKIAVDFAKNKLVYFMALPFIAYFIIFRYWPMYGVVIAFKEFNPVKGILGSEWIGFVNFKDFFTSYYFGRLLRNTLLMNIYDVLWGFPAPIILALLLNEVRREGFKRSIQTIIYIPHFISLMVVCGIILNFTGTGGLFNDILSLIGIERSNLLMRPELFRTIYIGSSIWQSVGWGSIVYLAALSAVNVEIYDAAIIDGANRWKQLLHVTIPGIMPTIIILLILRLGKMMNVGFEKIILLYNPVTYDTADVISSFVYRKGIIQADYSYSTAIGLFNSVINFAFLIGANKLSRKFSETSLW